MNRLSPAFSNSDFAGWDFFRELFPRPRRPTGMNTLRRPTFIHLLVTIAIFGVLLGLMLPALRASREASYDESQRSAATPASGLESAAPKSRYSSQGQSGDESVYHTALQLDDQAVEAGDSATDDALRKIIYEAQLSVVVEDLAATETALNKLMSQFGGYAAESSVARQQGEQLLGHWRVRVPIARFTEFMDAVADLGVAETRQQTAQDVTEEFVDLNARIANKKRLEERIVELLASATGKIKDVIEVEQELARVRGEIEQMEGRLRYLTNRTELTTVSIVAREEHDYVPPAAPTFATRITQAWHDSLESLQSFGERLSIAAVAAAPWVAIIGAMLLPAAWLLRKFVRRHAQGRVPPASAATAS